MPILKDQTKHKIDLGSTPRRIISIVPSQSEFLWDLGLREELVGISKFCIHPQEMFSSVTRVGGTKKLNFEKINSLKPDLIIGNKEENERSQIEALRKNYNVWMSDIYNFDDAFDMMLSLGKICGKEKQAKALVTKCRKAVASVKGIFGGQDVAYFIWREPYMLAAKNTFIDCMIRHVGLNNLAGSLTRYPEISLEDLKKMSPDYCFLSSEPYPFKEKHALELKKLLPRTKTLLVDGEMFSWYGSRMLELPGYMKKLKKEMDQ